MGANEKHVATYHGGEYTPTLDDLRDLWVDHKLDPLPRAQGIELVPTVQAEFDRWLETVRAEAKAEALNEVADEINQIDPSWDSALWVEPPGHYVPMTEWLRTRAIQYKKDLRGDTAT